MGRGEHLSRFFGSFWPLRGLRAKILWPILGLMAASLVLSTGAFVGGTVLTRNWLMEQRLEQDVARVAQFLISRSPFR